MPANTPQNYLDAARGYGAEIQLLPNIADAFAAIDGHVANGMTFVHPFDDEKVIAGQGTVGLEILEDCPQVTDVFCSIGGGGLSSGVAIAVRSGPPAVAGGELPKVYGVETAGADAMAQALATGHVVDLPAITSIAKTLGAPAVTERTLKLTQEYLESVTVVSDDDAIRELNYVAERLKVICEPASSCNLAAADKLKANFTPDSHVVIILCGGNFSLDSYCRFEAAD
jgi:threonine dehydratase